MSSEIISLSKQLKRYASTVGVTVLRHTRLEPEMMECARQLVDEASSASMGFKHLCTCTAYCDEHGLFMLLEVNDAWTT